MACETYNSYRINPGSGFGSLTILSHLMKKKWSVGSVACIELLRNLWLLGHLVLERQSTYHVGGEFKSLVVLKNEKVRNKFKLCYPGTARICHFYGRDTEHGLHI